MSDILLVGPKKMVEPLAACGIDVLACDSRRQGCEIIGQTVHPIVFITERLAFELQAEITSAEEKGDNIVVLPDHRGTTGYYQDLLGQLIKRATGAAKI